MNEKRFVALHKGVHGELYKSFIFAPNIEKAELQACEKTKQYNSNLKTKLNVLVVFTFDDFQKKENVQCPSIGSLLVKNKGVI